MAPGQFEKFMWACIVVLFFLIFLLRWRRPEVLRKAVGRLPSFYRQGREWDEARTEELNKLRDAQEPKEESASPAQGPKEGFNPHEIDDD